MRTIISVVLVTTIVLSATAAWAKTQVAVTLYPIFLLAQGVNDNENIDLICLQKSGDSHDLSISAKDIASLKNTKLLITNELGLDNTLVKTVRKSWQKIKISNVSKNLTLIRTKSNQDSLQLPSGYDPHVWLGFDNANIIQKSIADELIKISPKSKTIIQSNLKKCSTQINRLQTLSNTKLKSRKIKLIALHSAWAYLERSTGVSIIESLSVNPDSEPSAQRIREIIKIARTQKVHGFIVETGIPDKPIRTLIKEVKLPIIELNPLDTASNSFGFQHYIDTMNKNISLLATLK